MEKDVVISIKGMQKYENAEPDTIELVTGGRLERDGESFTLSYQESAVTGMDGTLTTFQIEPERVTLEAGVERMVQLMEAENLSRKEAAKRVAAETGLGKNELYQKSLVN